MNPRGAQFANAMVAEKVDESRRRCEQRHDEADRQQPRGDVRPLHRGGLPVHNVRYKRSEEADKRNRYEHRVERATAEAQD